MIGAFCKVRRNVFIVSCAAKGMDSGQPSLFVVISISLVAALFVVSFGMTLLVPKKQSLATGHLVFKDLTPFPDTSPQCNDTDGGIFSFITGNLSYRAGKGYHMLADTCRERSWGRSYVIEYYCREEKARIVMVPCKHGCTNGACLNESAKQGFSFP